MFCANNILNRQIKALGKKYGLSAEESYDIAKHQFEIVKNVFLNSSMDDPTSFKSVRIMYLGLFKRKGSVKQRLLAKKYIQNIDVISPLPTPALEQVIEQPIKKHKHYIHFK